MKNGLVIFIFFALLIFISTGSALPVRLVLTLDGVAYRDTKALQEGVTRTNFFGNRIQLRAFTTNEGYYPASRMVSTFPSTSDVAWTDIYGNRPLPGYQRTYFSAAANREFAVNGVTSTMVYERQMQWQVESGFVRAMSYVHPILAFDYELDKMVKSFWKSGSGNTNFYAYVRATDDAQHTGRDIEPLLCKLDQRLQDLRARYRAQEGRELQIVILSDHGHNHAGRGKRVKIREFLKKAGYRISESIMDPKDVVVPMSGIESWMEIHNSPAETERLMQRLTQLEGVDILTGSVPGKTNRFLVMNAKGERAIIEWNPARNSFRYSTEKGDPLNYRPVIESLARKMCLDVDGFATADAWMDETVTNRYPMALERIARGLTQVTLNPANILISLDNHYVSARWWVEKGSRLVPCDSTHGGLDDINSDGILLSNFTPTRDTSSSRVAGLLDDFPGLRQYRAEENGAEWVTKKEQALTRIARAPFDRDCKLLPDQDVFLRIWSPQFSLGDRKSPVEVAINRIKHFSTAQNRRGKHESVAAPGLRLKLNNPVSFPDISACERIYACPPGMVLEPKTDYQITGLMQSQGKGIPLFDFTFHTDSRSRPAAF